MATHGHTFVLCASVKLCDHESFNVKKERKKEREIGGMDREKETQREGDIEGKRERKRGRNGEGKRQR